ncbi:hypothetical protein ACJX0J_029449 [Zea mays]
MEGVAVNNNNIIKIKWHAIMSAKKRKLHKKERKGKEEEEGYVEDPIDLLGGKQIGRGIICQNVLKHPKDHATGEPVESANDFVGIEVLLVYMITQKIEGGDGLAHLVTLEGREKLEHVILTKLHVISHIIWSLYQINNHGCLRWEFLYQHAGLGWILKDKIIAFMSLDGEELRIFSCIYSVVFFFLYIVLENIIVALATSSTTSPNILNPITLFFKCLHDSLVLHGVESFYRIASLAYPVPQGAG